MADEQETITPDTEPLEADDAPETPTSDTERADDAPVGEGGTEEGETTPDADVEPAEPVAESPGRQPEKGPAPAEAASVPAHPFLSENFYPKEFKGYAVAEDGQDLADPRFEDPSSDEAATYFNQLIDKLGGDEDAANREYDVQRVRYETAKGSYENHITTIEEQASRASVSTVQAQVNEQGLAILADFDTLLPDLGKSVIASFHGKAVGVIGEGLQTLTQNYIEQGFSPRRAEARATADFAAQKSLYKDALELAVAEDPVGFARLVLETAGVKTAKTGATPDSPPRPNPPPMSGGGGRGGQPERVASRIVPTEAERAAAEAADADPVEFARAHRERFGLISTNGATTAGAGGRR